MAIFHVRFMPVKSQGGHPPLPLRAVLPMVGMEFCADHREDIATLKTARSAELFEDGTKYPGVRAPLEQTPIPIHDPFAPQRSDQTAHSDKTPQRQPGQPMRSTANH